MASAGPRARALEWDFATKRSENVYTSWHSCAAFLLVLIAFVSHVAYEQVVGSDTTELFSWGYHGLGLAAVLLVLQCFMLRYRPRRDPMTPTPAGFLTPVQEEAAYERVQTLKVDLAYERRCNRHAFFICLAAILLVITGFASHAIHWAGMSTTWPSGTGMVSSTCAFAVLGVQCAGWFTAPRPAAAGLPPAPAVPPPAAAVPPPAPPPPQTYWPPALSVERFPLDGYPPEFMCRITLAPMANPAVTPHGTSYDRDELRTWITANHTYPMHEVRAAHFNHTHAPRTACAPLTPRYYRATNAAPSPPTTPPPPPLYSRTRALSSARIPIALTLTLTPTRGKGHSSSMSSRPTTRCAASWRRGSQRTRPPASDQPRAGDQPRASDQHPGPAG